MQGDLYAASGVSSRQLQRGTEMLCLLSRRSSKMSRVMPDDTQADTLRRKLAALNFVPTNGFHKDRKQDRIGSALPPTRWQKLA